MSTTTSYGGWLPHGDEHALTVGDTIRQALGDDVDDFDLVAIEREYREAIDAALPEGIGLHGEEFIGPSPPLDVDIAACVASVDLWPIIERHATGEQQS
jgi:hypothetical protein